VVGGARVIAEDAPASAGPMSRLGHLLTPERLTSASSVLVGANVANNLLRLASTIVLTRLLSPNDFGAIAMIGSIFYVIAMITDAGFEAYVVRHERGDDPHFLNAIWTIHLTRGVLNALAAAALAVPLASVLQKPEVAPLLAVAAISLAIDGAMSLSFFTALRRNMVRRLSMIDLSAQFCQFLVGIVAALILRNAWALVISLITTSIVRTFASYVVFPDTKRRLSFDRPLASDLWRFSRVIAASSMLTLVISQVDKLVLARVLTLQQFGIYAIATNLATAPASIAYQYSSRIFYPALAATWRTEPEKIRQVYYKLRGRLFYFYLFGGGVLIGSAPLIIRILYDPRYLYAGFYLRLLAIATTLVIVTYTANAALVAMGQTRTAVVGNLIRIAWLLPVGLTGFFIFGPIGLIVAIAVIELPASVYLSIVQIRQHLFDYRLESLAWLTVGFGAGVGFLADAVARSVLSL
jgi:O-antigen/teichoic acid export membrane protein